MIALSYLAEWARARRREPKMTEQQRRIARNVAAFGELIGEIHKAWARAVRRGEVRIEMASDLVEQLTGGAA